jgi:hypothetical protein
MSRIVKRYRQTSYGDIYTMEFVSLSDGTYAISCTEHPSNPYSTDVALCHLYSSGQVCVASGCEPKTLDRAKAIATAFMDGYSQYIRTGTFPNGAKNIRV